MASIAPALLASAGWISDAMLVMPSTRIRSASSSLALAVVICPGTLLFWACL